MDHFGIGAAIKGMAEMFFRSGRRTGRTTSLLDSLKDGDRVCCLNRQAADDFRIRLKERKLEVEVLVLDPGTPERLCEYGTPKGRLIFDHSWVEQYYLKGISQAQENIDYFQREFSGRGEAHLETRRQAEEIRKWRL